MLRSGGQSTGVSSCLLGVRPLPKLGDAAAARALRAHWRLRSMFWPAEPVKHDFIIFPPAAAGGTLRGVPCRASPLDGRGLDTLQGNSTPKAFPWGKGGAAGSDEGAIWYPTFPCRKGEALVSRPGGIFLLPRWASRSPPHQSPSVTASPQGEASGLCYPTRKKRPKSGYADGHRNSPPTGTLRSTTPKRASGNERAIKKGGPGGKAPGALSSGFLRRKPGSRPESGGNPRRRSGPATVPTEPPTDDREPPRRAGGATGRCAPRHRKSPDHPKGTQYRPTPTKGVVVSP